MNNEFDFKPENPSKTKFDFIPLASDELLSIANANQMPSNRKILPQEEFSNPIEYPGFEQLSPNEQKERLAFSQFDPANQTAMGTAVPPGTHEQPYARRQAETLLLGMLPQFRGMNPLAAIPARIGAGTAATTALSATSPENVEKIGNMDDLLDLATRNLKLNAMIEGATLPIRAIPKIAEVQHPMSYTNEKILPNIAKTYSNAVKEQRAAYNHPSVTQYNNFPVTLTPQKYLDDIGIIRKKLLPETRDLYDKLLKNPSFSNLHQFQSRLNEDVYRTSEAFKPITRANYNKWGRALKNKAYSFLGRNPEALAKYKEGDFITKNEVEPFRAHKELEQIAEGTRKKIEPKKLAKIITEEQSKKRSKIPESHYLNNVLKDLEHVISKGEFAKNALPIGLSAIGGTLGGVGGHAMAPGMGGILGGSGGATAGAILGHYLNPHINKLAENEWLRNKIKNIFSPLYHIGTREQVIESERKRHQQKG